MINFERFTHLSFDCYGTLIDWEAGILGALRPILERHGVKLVDEQILALYSRYEEEGEGGDYKPYRDILRSIMNRIAPGLGIVPTEAEVDALAKSVGSWPVFPDTVQALEKLKTRYKLVILSNVDDDLFAETAKLLKLEFDEVITAQQVGSYKPSPGNFHFMLKRLGVPMEKVLHVAQSLFHDHAPAKALGFTTVWINRPDIRRATGRPSRVDLPPDLEVADLRSLVDAIGL